MALTLYRTPQTFFCLGKFLKWWADNLSSSMTKGRIYYIKHLYIQPFSMEVDWREIRHQMDVSNMFYICRHCVFTLWGRLLKPRPYQVHCSKCVKFLLRPAVCKHFPIVLVWHTFYFHKIFSYSVTTKPVLLVIECKHVSVIYVYKLIFLLHTSRSTGYKWLTV